MWRIVSTASSSYFSRCLASALPIQSLIHKTPAWYLHEHTAQQCHHPKLQSAWKTQIMPVHECFLKHASISKFSSRMTCPMHQIRSRTVSTVACMKFLLFRFGSTAGLQCDRCAAGHLFPISYITAPLLSQAVLTLGKVLGKSTSIKTVGYPPICWTGCC